MICEVSTYIVATIIVYIKDKIRENFNIAHFIVATDRDRNSNNPRKLFAFPENGEGRCVPDAELDGFVDVLARRIASFDRRPIAAAKHLMNQVSLPYADRLLDALNAFQTALTWPETQQRIQALLFSADSNGKATSKRWPRCSARSSDVGTCGDAQPRRAGK